MHIVHYPHPALRWKSKPLTEINSELRDIVQQMFDLMYESEGIGLAANQVALPYRVFVLNLTGDRAEKDQEIVFINPEIVERKGSDEAEEGCLSLPKLYRDVRRPEQIVVEAYGLDGEGFELSVDGLAARAIQHEIDHLDGVLFTDRLTEIGTREVAPILADFEAAFRRQQQLGVYPSDEELKRKLKEIEPRCE